MINVLTKKMESNDNLISAIGMLRNQNEEKINWSQTSNSLLKQIMDRFNGKLIIIRRNENKWRTVYENNLIIQATEKVD